MHRLIRVALQVVLFFLLLGTVIGLGSGDIGPVEKVALAVLAANLIWIAVLVGRFGSRSAPPSA